MQHYREHAAPGIADDLSSLEILPAFDAANRAG